MDLLKPNISEAEARDLVKRLYGLEVTSIRRMKSYDDQNFHILVSQEHQNPYVTMLSEKGYTLKITNTKKSSQAGHFDMMHEMMNHCKEKGMHTPTPLRNLDGATWSLERVTLLNEDNNTPGPKLSGIHLLSYVPGSPLSSIDCTTDTFFQWGQLLAQFHDAVEDFSRERLPKTIFWSLENIPRIAEYTAVLTEDQKELVNAVLHKYSSQVEGHLSRLPKGPIHGDFNEDNVLVQTEEDQKVKGILDFEDIHEGTYVWDVAVMMAYALLNCNDVDPLRGPKRALDGYLELRSLNDLELSILKACMECRLCQSLVLCAYSYSQDSSNTYLLQSAKTGWTKLKHITKTQMKTS